MSYPVSPQFETPSAQFRAPKRRKSRVGPIAAVTAGALALVGVGVFAALTFRGKPAAQPLAQTTSIAASAAAAKPAATTPAPVKPKTGQEVTRAGGAKITAFSWKTPAAKKAPQPSEFDWPAGYVWAALDVQVCLPAGAPDDSSVSSFPWTVRFADNSTAEFADVTGITGWPKPQYPMGDRRVPAGSCTRGWITYAAPAGAKPVAALYAPPDGAPVEWTMA